jgi:hypothetical protein
MDFWPADNTPQSNTSRPISSRYSGSKYVENYVYYETSDDAGFDTWGWFWYVFIDR